MAMQPNSSFFFFLFFFTMSVLDFSCFNHIHAMSYDYSYTHGCVPTPKTSQYDGGVVVNPSFDDGLKGWKTVGSATIKVAHGNNYVVVSSALFQTLHTEKGKIYTVSAWVQVSEGKAKVQARLQTANGTNTTANWITAQSGCWKMIKGGFTVNSTGPADIHFEGNVGGVDIWIDNVSVQPFTRQEWKSQQDDSREKARKTKVRFEAADKKGQPIANATVSIRQRWPTFPFGAAINQIILNNPTYQNWFLERFQYAVFENELKWAAIEKVRGVQNYTTADAMLNFCKSNGVKVRGHNILWDNERGQPKWALTLSTEELEAAAYERVNSVVGRYRGEFIHWDVVNENMHWNFLSKLHPGKFDAAVFNLTHRIDPSPVLFLNEYSVIEGCGLDAPANPSNYLDKIAEMRSAGYDGPLGIGLQSHFGVTPPEIAYVRASLDMFASTGLPVWITEFDVNFDVLANPLEYLEMLLREFHSHPAVCGIMFWTAMAEGRCWKMCLMNENYTNNPAGDVVDKFIGDFIKVGGSNGTTDSNGVFEVSLFHGEYEANITLHNGIQTSVSEKFSVLPSTNVTIVLLKSSAVMYLFPSHMFSLLYLLIYVIINKS